MALLKSLLGYSYGSFGERLNWQVGQGLLGGSLKTAFVTCL